MTAHSAELVAISVIISVVAGVAAWIIWVIASNIRRSRTSRDMVNVHARLLDRFSNSSDLISYLEGNAGKRFFESLTADVRDSMNRILHSIQAGVVLFLLGIVFLALRGTQDDLWLRQMLLLAGAPTATVGAGLLISAFVAFRLCRSWGLMQERGPLDKG